jgi:hypothetical protein
MSTFEMTLITFAVGLALIALGFWVAMIRHCWLHVPADGHERWVWLAIIVLGKLPGALAYFFLRDKVSAA